MKNPKEYEKYIIYRLINVLYWGSLIFFVLVILLFGWFEKPYKTLDTQNSYIECDNGKTYSYENLNVNFYFDSNDDIDARKICFDRKLQVYSRSKESIVDVSLEEYLQIRPLDEFLNNYIPSPNYTVHEVDKTNGAWLTPILVWVIGLVGLYILLNIIKESLLYISFGKRFSWKWLTTFINY